MSSNRPRTDVTVAVSTINRPASLARCLAAILDGALLPRDIVIVDQSSDDATEVMVRTQSVGAAVPVRYLRQPQRGLAASRNLAIAQAASRIVAFTDDDCVPDESWLATIVAAFGGADRPNAVTGRILPLGPEQPGLFAVSSRPDIRRAVYRGRALPWTVGSGGNTAIEREWLVRIGGFDESLGASSPGMSAEDTDVLYRLLRAGATVQYEPGAAVFHERQDLARRLASRTSYGFGLGAFCAKWARHGDPYSIAMLAHWMFDRARALAASFIRRRGQRIREELMMLRGALHGVAYGLSRRSLHHG
jgi:GT2 family glycosyltransferase